MPKEKPLYLTQAIQGKNYSTDSLEKLPVKSKATYNLVTKAVQSREFEIYQPIQIPLGSGKFAFVGQWKIAKSHLKTFGITPANGLWVHLLVSRTQTTKEARSIGELVIIRVLDANLRTLSDMRTKPKWEALPWLAPAIEAIYQERDRLTRETGIEHHVDHIHPVNHPRLCGLTVPWNLQIITAEANRKKSNKLELL